MAPGQRVVNMIGDMLCSGCLPVGLRDQRRGYPEPRASHERVDFRGSTYCGHPPGAPATRGAWRSAAEWKPLPLVRLGRCWFLHC